MSTAFLYNRKALLSAAGILVLGGGAWGVVALTSGPKSTLPEDLSVNALKAKAAEDPGKVFERVHDAMRREDLTEEQQHELRENAREVMDAQIEQRLDEYFVASQDQRKMILDRQLDEMQSRMKEWQQRRTERERDGAPQGERPRPSGAAPAAEPGSPGTTPQARPGPDDRSGRFGDRRGPPTQEQRKMRSESRDPDQRARRMAYFTALRKRAEERGIQMPFFGGGPGGGPGGGR
ncbi:MAG: hypothetical protein JXA69_00905 [Phycisphaerae bacterium]|nr:hypothetical protein [Phycisphaerae bacterium]